MIQGGKTDFDRLAEVFRILRQECDLIRRNPDEIELTVGTGIRSVDDGRRLEDLGIARVVGGPS